MAIPKSGENPRRKKPRIPKKTTQQSSSEQDSTEDIEQYKKRIAALEAQLAQKQAEEKPEPESLPTVEPEPKPKSKRKPVQNKKAPEPEPEPDEEDEEWEVHPKTGVKYKKIPPAQLDADGLPISTITDDIDLMDFNNSAQQFLAHLQVPPSQKEQQRMRAEREKRAKEAQAQFEEKWKDYKRPKPKSR